MADGCSEPTERVRLDPPNRERRCLSSGMTPQADSTIDGGVLGLPERGVLGKADCTMDHRALQNGSRS